MTAAASEEEEEEEEEGEEATAAALAIARALDETGGSDAEFDNGNCKGVDEAAAAGCCENLLVPFVMMSTALSLKW